MNRDDDRAGLVGILIAPVVVIAVLLGGVVLLERSGPTLDEDLTVSELPPLALREDRRGCSRDTGDDRAAELRADVIPGARVTSTMVLGCPQAFDQLPVTYVGEAVGDVLHRRGGAWVQVNDDAYALELGPLPAHGRHAGTNSGLAVWVPEHLVGRLGEVGGPQRRGDVVLVTAVVHRTDPADGGGLTLRASDLEVLAASTMLERPLHVPQAIAAGLAAIAALGASLYARRARRI